MSHQYNQRVFATVDITSPLLYSYIRLVGVELGLKNGDSANWILGHQIEVMIARLGKPALYPLSQRLGTVLASLWCEKKGGGSAPVSAANYPTIRYLRHASDFLGSSDSTPDTDLLDLKNAVNDLVNELRREGVLA